MKILLTYLLLLGTVALPAEGQDKRRGSKENDSNVVTGKSGARSLVPVNVSVRGLSSQNSSQVTEALRSLSHSTYSCSRCSAQTHQAEACSSCSSSTSLTLVESTPVFSRIGMSTDRGRLIVTVNPHHWASLQQVTPVLTVSGATIERGKFRLPSNCRVKLRGVAPKHAARVRGALVDLKVLNRVIVTTDANGIWIVPLQGGGVSLGEIEDVLTRLNPAYTVEDVQWASYCPRCGRVPTMRMGNPDCRGQK